MTRLFIGLTLPADVKAVLTATQDRFKAQKLAVRWAAPAGLHLTLQFLGETSDSLIQPLISALDALPSAAINLSLDRVKAFPDHKRPHVLWASVLGDLPQLHELHAQVLKTTGPFGFVPEERPFTPHITLGRIRPGFSPEQMQALSESLQHTAPPEPSAWLATRPILFKSAGSVYTPLHG